jgi:hypothetical protein
MTSDDQVMRFLAAGVPVTLLLDLAAPPDAGDLYVSEGGSADWLVPVTAGAA